MEMIEESRLIKAFLCDYADAYTLVTGDIAVTGANANTRVAFKNCHPFVKCKTHLKVEDSTVSLYQFKKQEQSYDNDNPTDIVNITANNSSSFKYKSGFLGTIDVIINANVNPNIELAHRYWRNVQIIVPLKYI